MEQRFLVDERNKCWRAGGALGDIENLEALALIRGRLHTRGRARQHLVQCAGRDAGAVLHVHILDGFKQFVQPLTGFCADEQDGRIRHKAEILFQLLAHLVHGVAVFFNGIPLVYSNNAGLALVMGITGNLGILLRKADGCINHDNAHAAAFHSSQAAQHAVALHTAFHLAALAQTGGIGKDKLAVLVFHHGINGITGGTCLIGNNQAVFAQNMVDQAGFAHVGAANNGNRNAVLFFLIVVIKVQVFTHGI